MPTSNSPPSLCDFCKKTPYDHVSGVFFVKGLKIQFGVCHACYQNSDSGILFCPTCLSLYEPHSKAWGEDWDAPSCATVPCKKHSASKAAPQSECVVCHETGKYFHHNLRGSSYCENCWFQNVACAAPYCEISIHPAQEGIIATPGGSKHYCSDCALIRTIPKLLSSEFHPLSWDYDPLCHCMACKTLRGKSPEWKAPFTMPEPDCVCSICLYDVNSNTTVVLEGDKIYCHACQKKLKVCNACKQPKHNKQFHHSHYLASHKYHRACDDCLSNTSLWLCNAACNQWFKDSEKCNCGGVFPYNYTPNPLNFLVSTSERAVDEDVTPFLGLELEVEAHSRGSTRLRGAKLVKSIASDFSYLVHDGTLKGEKSDGTGGQYGFEIVTHPFTFNWFEENWHKFEELLEALSAKGYRSWEGKRCGLHVHISRAPMSDAHQMKFIKFVNGSVNMMLCVGQRGYRDANLHKHAPFHTEDRSQLMSKITENINPGVHGHYTALNTLNPATLEARWFRGTLNPLGVRKNVEFMHSLWHFTKIFGMTSANEINYINWLREPQQARPYYALLDYLERNYVTRR